MSEQIADRKIYSRRTMRGLTSPDPHWAQLGDPDDLPLSDLLAYTAGACKGEPSGRRLFLCGSLEQATKEYFEGPIAAGWEFARPYIHKFRSPVYRLQEGGKEVSVKLAGESWLPGCEDITVAIPAWRALKAEWERETDIPLLSTPGKTGQALLWESFPRGAEYPALPAALAKLIRGVSPQHRLEKFIFYTPEEFADHAINLHAYDGRWMYAGCCLSDRLPIGEARKVGGFEPFTPGWYRVRFRIPQAWQHIGLLPVKSYSNTGEYEWSYPNLAGGIYETWTAEPELTLALQHGWEILDVIDGYAFDKGRPLLGWARKLIGMRERLSGGSLAACNPTPARTVAAAAPREILNHTIGSFHVNTYEREGIVAEVEYRELIAEWGYSRVATLEKLRGGKRRVSYPATHFDRLSIYMPHWSATIWALERAWIARHALQCDPATLIEIRGDCIYSTAELPFKDDGHLSQLRPKAV